MFQELGRLVEETGPGPCRVVGQEHFGEGDVLELAQVAEAVFDGQTSLASPTERFSQPALPGPQPRPHRRDRSDIWEEVTDVTALGFIEQVECTVQISFSVPHPR